MRRIILLLSFVASAIFATAQDTAEVVKTTKTFIYKEEVKQTTTEEESTFYFINGSTDGKVKMRVVFTETGAKGDFVFVVDSLLGRRDGDGGVFVAFLFKGKLSHNGTEAQTIFVRQYDTSTGELRYLYFINPPDMIQFQVQQKIVNEKG